MCPPLSLLSGQSVWMEPGPSGVWPIWSPSRTAYHRDLLGDCEEADRRGADVGDPVTGTARHCYTVTSASHGPPVVRRLLANATWARRGQRTDAAPLVVLSGGRPLTVCALHNVLSPHWQCNSTGLGSYSMTCQSVCPTCLSRSECRAAFQGDLGCLFCFVTFHAYSGKFAAESKPRD